MKKYYSLALFVMLIASTSISFGFKQGPKRTNNTSTTDIKPKKEIYLQLYSVRDDIKTNYQATIDSIARIGYTGVEAAGYSDGKFYGLTPQNFKKSIEKTGMKVFSSHAGHPLAKEMKKTDWDEVWKWWDTAIQAHKEAGIKYLVFPWTPTPKTMNELKANSDYLNKIGEKCNAAGIRFGYHNHDFEFKEIDGQTIYDYLLQNTDPKKVFFQMDVYWTMKGGKNPVNYFNKYPGRFKSLHIKDEKELGTSGKINFEAIFRNLEKAGTKYIIIEVERYNYPPIKSVRQSFDYLNKAPFVKNTYL